MSIRAWFAMVTVAATAVAAVTSGCAQDGGDPFGDSGVGNDGSSNADGASSATCQACVIDSDCSGGGVCAQLGGDSYCASTCTSTSQCPNGEQCTSVTTIAGDQVSVCVDVSNAQCGLQQPPPSGDAGTPPPSGCPGWASPTSSASCTSCKQGSNGCQPNGCYGGWWCNTNTNKCQSAPPQNCGGTTDAGPPQVYDGGVTGNIGVNGGTESRLYFAVVGDTRPANEDDTANYPTAIIDTIYSDLAKVSPMPPFVVSTGDYQFSKPSGSQAAAQITDYLNARKSYAGVLFPAMGNHECTGATASNCGSGNTNGITNNYSSFMSMMLGPIQKSAPYYSINVAANDNSWTAKFVFVAANAWDSTQASWLGSTLAQKTTYTFVVRHEPASATTAPGTSPSETIMKQYPYTLAIVGHSHEYYHSSGSREVVVGNGGAPISTSQDYGYALVQQLTNGHIQVDMYDYQTNAKDSSFEFNVSP